MSERIEATGMTPQQLYNALDLFIERVQNKYGQVSAMYPDSAEQTLINGIKTMVSRKYPHIIVRNSIKEEIIATKHHEDVEQNSASRKHVERNTTFLETLEETRSYLETNHEDEEDQAEVLHESENFLWTGEANVASQNTCEENEGDT